MIKKQALDSKGVTIPLFNSDVDFANAVYSRLFRYENLRLLGKWGGTTAFEFFLSQANLKAIAPRASFAVMHQVF